MKCLFWIELIALSVIVLGNSYCVVLLYADSDLLVHLSLLLLSFACGYRLGELFFQRARRKRSHG